ncbi:MAG: hypothetical protein D6728_16995 [Cyanobacteria bacterium J055]|nr:MAG: hypothetical protein D6728_16995 [Cyanobacteria bacterium J055]
MTISKETTKTQTVLRKGSTGDDVIYLQNTLNYIYGPDLKVDGIFGAQTEATVKRFQKDFNLVVDGIVGDKTWARLVELHNAPVTC